MPARGHGRSPVQAAGRLSTVRACGVRISAEASVRARLDSVVPWWEPAPPTRQTKRIGFQTCITATHRRPNGHGRSFGDESLSFKAVEAARETSHSSSKPPASGPKYCGRRPSRKIGNSYGAAVPRHGPRTSGPGEDPAGGVAGHHTAVRRVEPTPIEPVTSCLGSRPVCASNDRLPRQQEVFQRTTDRTSRQQEVAGLGQVLRRHMVWRACRRSPAPLGDG
jgi:hypothetical protein